MVKIRCLNTVSLLAMAAELLAPYNAQAQLVDYGSLQSLFGEPITTSATGTPQRAKEVAANMTILTAEDIRRSGSRNIPEALHEVPGIDVLRTGVNTYDVGVRGFNQPNSNRLLVLINGRQVFFDDFSRTDWNALPLNIDEVRQIEVVKGPNAALFGNNAVGGVINIITYNPMYDKVNVANITGGTQESRSADATVTQKLGDWGGLKLSAGDYGAHAFDTSRTSVDQSQTADPRRHYASADAVFKLAPETQAEVETTYVRAQESGANIGDVITFSANEVYSFKGMLASQTSLGFLRATSYFNHIHSEYNTGLIPSGNAIADDLWVNQLEDQFKLGSDHTFRIAGEYRTNSFAFAALQAIPQSPKIGMDMASLSGMWSWQVTNHVSVTNAIRIDQWHLQQLGTLWGGAQYSAADYNRYVTNLDANSGIVWQATDIDTLRLTYGRGIQFPSFFESGFASIPVSSPVFVNFQSNPNLNPTIVTNVEADYDREVKPIFSTVSAAVFYQLNQNIKGLSDTTIPGFPVTFTTNSNLGDDQAIGFEIGVSGKKSGFRWGLSDSLAFVSAGTNVEQNFHVEQSAPEDSLKAQLGYSWDNWELDGFGNYVSKRISETESSTTVSGAPSLAVPAIGYTSFSGRVGYNITDNFTLALSGTDLNHQQITTFAGAPNIERQVFLGLTGKF